MNRLLSGLVCPIALLVVVAGCSSDPTADLANTPVGLVAAPSQLFIEVGRTKTIEVGAVDEQGNQLAEAYEAAAASGIVTVKRDSSFLPVFVNDSTLAPPTTAPRFRFIVTGVQFGATKITFTGAGQTLDVPVQVVPISAFPATFSNATPALDELVTATAPAGSRFTDSSKATLPGAALQPITTAVAADGTTISFFLPPNVDGPITFTNVFTDATPNLVFSPATVDKITSPQFDSVDVTFSTTTPTMGQTVTATIVDNPLVTFTPVIDSISFLGQLSGRASGPQNIVIAPDGRSLTFEAPPNIAGAANVFSFAFPNGYVIALPTKAIVTSQTVLPLTIDATFSNQAPAIFDPVTLTAPAGFSFAQDVAINVGSSAAIIQSVAADGSSVDLIPLPGSDGTATIDGVIVNSSPQFLFTQATVQTITVPTLTPLVGTDDPATAPALTFPTLLRDAGSFAFTCDAAGGVPCQVYAVHFDAPTAFTYTLTGIGSPADLGVYFATSADLATDVGHCDALGRAAPPENCVIPLAAGDYIMEVVTFGPFYPENDPNPPFIQVQVQ